MLDPRKLCRFHLLGEHRALHARRSSAQRNLRHAILVAEMKRRGYKHKSAMEPSGEDTPVKYSVRECVHCKRRAGK